MRQFFIFAYGFCVPRTLTRLQLRCSLCVVCAHFIRVAWSDALFVYLICAGVWDAVYCFEFACIEWEVLTWHLLVHEHSENLHGLECRNAFRVACGSSFFSTKRWCRQSYRNWIDIDCSMLTKSLLKLVSLWKLMHLQKRKLKRDARCSKHC